MTAGLTENTIEVLDHGFVRLDDAMADDLSVVNGARVSFARRKLEMDESDEGLIRFLMRDRHGTPFEHNSFRFHIRCPIFVAREWMRHRVGSFNEFSLRYARATDDFYVPEPEDVRSQVGKPGAYSFEPVSPEVAEATREKLLALYDAAYETSEELVELGVAEGEEVHQLAGVHRPVELGVRPDRECAPGQLAGDAELDQLLVGLVGGLVDGLKPLARLLGYLVRDRLERVGARLPDLRADVLRLRDVEVVRRFRISKAELVERTDPVPHPLPRHEDRRADVEPERVVLEGGPVPIPHQEADQALV